jgi:hypothetical protein
MLHSGDATLRHACRNSTQTAREREALGEARELRYAAMADNAATPTLIRTALS